MPASNKPTVLIASINGVRSKLETVPFLPADVTREMLACIDAGSSIIHFHTDRVKVSGEVSAERYLEAWKPVAEVHPDALFYPTVNWGPDGKVNYDHIPFLAASGYLRLGVNDLGTFAAGELINGIPVGDIVFSNTFDRTAERIALYSKLGIGMATQIPTPSAMRTIMRFWRAGLLPRGTSLNFHFFADPEGPPPWSAVSSLPPTAPALAAMLDMLGDCPIPWAASVWGGTLRDNAFLDAVLAAGGHLNMGLECFRGDVEMTNLELVQQAADLVARKGHQVATQQETLSLFDIPENALA